MHTRVHEKHTSITKRLCLHGIQCGQKCRMQNVHTINRELKESEEMHRQI